jgi:predicted PhzF superfamily epimerase YddE/YHI9
LLSIKFSILTDLGDNMQTITKVHKVAAFTAGEEGGNPAGVMIRAACRRSLPCSALLPRWAIRKPCLPRRTAMAGACAIFRRMARWFCGHATIALGAVLAQQNGDGIFPLTTNHAQVTVEGRAHGNGATAALQSPATSSSPASPALVQEALKLFGYALSDLDDRIPPAIASGGVQHLVLALASRDKLRAMRYELGAGRSLMQRYGLTTISLVHAETPQRFHARNAFASSGVYEDPATGAAAAALAGYLRDLDWPHGGAIDIIQGEDMGAHHAKCRFRTRPAVRSGSRARPA